MNDADTADIVRRIVSTWPMSPKGVIWTEALTEMDYAPCLAAYIRLRDELDEQRISVARFRMTVRGIEAGARAATTRRHPSETAPEEGPGISFDDYLARLTWRATMGEAQAQEDLDAWDTPFAKVMLGILQGTAR